LTLCIASRTRYVEVPTESGHKHYISVESTVCRFIQILTRGVATLFERHVNMSKRDLTVDIKMSVKLASSLRDEISAAHLHC